MKESLQDNIKSILSKKPEVKNQRLNEMVKGRIMSPDEAIKNKLNPKLSAVLLLIYEENQQHNTVFTLRHSYEGVHSNQVSLPGGKMEDHDEDLARTALRETEEEIGVPMSNITLLGELTQIYIPPSNFIVQPFVGFMKSNSEFVPEAKEVKEIITTPISRLFENDVLKEKEIYMSRYDKNIEIKYFDINDHVVWGATAIILEEFRFLMKEIF